MAEGLFNKIILWALLGLFIVIFLFIFYGPKEGFMGKIANLALGVEKYLPIQSQREVKPNEKTVQWLKILQEYEQKKCVVNQYTCKAENLNCQCFALGQKQNKEAPDTCDASKPYCYDGQIGCSREGPDKPLYFDYCRQTNPKFNLAQIPDCAVDNKCKASNMPCKCSLASGQYEICIETGESYCYQGNFGCYAQPC